jgi:hypothetical protein
MLAGMAIIAHPALGQLQVDCAVPGQTITAALQTAQSGDTIRVQGTCEQNALRATF